MTDHAILRLTDPISVETIPEKFISVALDASQIIVTDVNTPSSF